ncbi:M12 family metallopeptidase [Panacagrimonas perspica]|uniref:M12 family metallopeptidase n=1 Tax=Panacagrimonas perspica TaxID=381431 RepID=UPI0013C2F1B7|nr:M12 family metallopeptidase [Panacagrimonas perspica]
MSISSWVGSRGNATATGNLDGDVRTIQKLLNKVPAAQAGPSPLLKVDGVAGQKTRDAIQKFQLKRFGWKGADARVDPKGQTLVALNEFEVVPPDPDQEIVLSAIAEWNTVLKGHVTWRPATDQDASLVVFTKTSDINKSRTGRDSPNGKQDLNVNVPLAIRLSRFGAATAKGVILHEMGHAAGLGHEHQRDDRNTYVTVIWNNIKRYCDYRIRIPLKTDPVPTACGPFTQCSPFGGYDLGSTMHYFPNQTGKDESKPTLVAIDKKTKKPLPSQRMGGLDGLMPGDIATLKHFYPAGAQ